MLKAVENEMLQRLQRDYATMVDITVGQRSEKLSQIVAAIGKLVDSNGADDGSSGVVYTHRSAAYFDELGGSLMGWL